MSKRKENAGSSAGRWLLVVKRRLTDGPVSHSRKVGPRANFSLRSATRDGVLDMVMSISPLRNITKPC